MAHIAIIGSGVVGEATGKAFASYGHQVTFSDIDGAKLEKLTREGYRTLRPEALLHEGVDVFFLTVGTPSTAEGKVELKFIEEAARSLGRGPLRHLRHYPVIVVKSTVPPGTTTQFVTRLLEEGSGKKAGVDFGLAFEPEYLREKTAAEDAQEPRHITIGTNETHAGNIVEWLRVPFHAPITRLTIEEAELQKYAHNLWNATKISFFNEMRSVAKKLEISDVEKVFELVNKTAEASWNPLYGTRDLGPFDGMCLPKDTSGFLKWAEEKLSLPLPLLEAVIAVNKKLEKEEKNTDTVAHVSEFPLVAREKSSPSPHPGLENDPWKKKIAPSFPYAS